MTPNKTKVLTLKVWNPAPTQQRSRAGKPMHFPGDGTWNNTASSPALFLLFSLQDQRGSSHTSELSWKQAWFKNHSRLSFFSLLHLYSQALSAADHSLLIAIPQGSGGRFTASVGSMVTVSAPPAPPLLHRLHVLSPVSSPLTETFPGTRWGLAEGGGHAQDKPVIRIWTNAWRSPLWRSRL